MSRQLNKIANDCFGVLSHTERDDLLIEDFHSFLGRILGVFSTVVSYHESINSLCLAGHALNSSILLRSQLEAHLILSYLTFPDSDIEEIESRVHLYEDWVMIKMYQNSNKSKDFDLFTLNTNHKAYLIQVETNYLNVKESYSDKLDLFKDLEKSQSFLKNKRKVAIENDIEDLYSAVFSETSATVHMADISDRMTYVDTDFDGYEYKIRSQSETMMMIGLSNILLLKSINRYLEFLKIPKEIKSSLFKEVYPSH